MGSLRGSPSAPGLAICKSSASCVSKPSPENWNEWVEEKTKSIATYLVLKRLNEAVKRPRNKGPQERPQPVNPMLGIKRRRDHTGAKAARRIQRSARELDAHQLSNEERQADAHGRDEGGAVLLGREHVDGEDQLGRQDGLNEDALGDGGAAAQCGAHVEVLGEEEAHEHRGKHPADHLRDEEADGAGDRDGADEEHGQSDGGVEEATADTEEDLIVIAVS